MRIKYPAVIVATLCHFLLGGLWYSPLLFQHKFLQLINWSPAKIQEMGNESHNHELVMALVTSFILCYVLAHFVQYTKADNVAGGLLTAFWLWLGFIATTNVATVLFEERALGLYLINMGYQLVACAIAGVILALWRPPAAVEPAA